MKIALYGGSFDPPHNGHTLLCEHLATLTTADKIIIMPAHTSPFKTGCFTSDSDRLEMCRLAFPSPLYEVSDLEIKRGGKSYTVDTLTELKKIYPNGEFYLFMGDDMFLSFNRWYEYQKILSLCTLVAACRTEDKRHLDEMKIFAEKELGLKAGQYLLSADIPFEISSTEVREKLKNRENAKQILPKPVFDYITSKELYKMNRDEEYQRIIKERLSQNRYIHSMNVAKSAKELALRYGADPAKAYTAGILHDICKEVPPAEQLAYLTDNGVSLTKTEVNAPKLFHAMSGALYIEHALGVNDPEIIGAVRYHTTGKAGMNLLEKVVFIADFISDERDYPGVDEMRKKAKISLDEAIVEGLSFTVKDLIDNGRCVHTDTVEALNDALLNVSERK